MLSLEPQIGLIIRADISHLGTKLKSLPSFSQISQNSLGNHALSVQKPQFLNNIAVIITLMHLFRTPIDLSMKLTLK